MGWKENLRKGREKLQEQRRAAKTYSELIRQRTLQARRLSYEKEAIKQASARGARMAVERANRPSFFQVVNTLTTKKAVPKKVVRKKHKRKVAYRRVPIRRRVTYRRVPVRRTRRRYYYR